MVKKFENRTGGEPPSSIEKHISTEKEKEPKTKVLVLEDKYSKEAQEGLNLPYLEVKVIETIEELREIDLKDFNPDILILDLEVPEKKGEKPKYKEIIPRLVKEKFKDAIIVYYTSHDHHGRMLGGVGDSPATAMEDGLKLFLEDKYQELLKIDPGLENIADKSNPDNWKRVLEVIPIISPSYVFGNKLKLFFSWPKEVRDKILALKRVDSASVAEAIKRHWEIQEKNR